MIVSSNFGMVSNAMRMPWRTPVARPAPTVASPQIGLVGASTPAEHAAAGVVGGVIAASMLGAFGGGVQNVAVYGLGGLVALTAVLNVASAISKATETAVPIDEFI